MHLDYRLPKRTHHIANDPRIQARSCTPNPDCATGNEIPSNPKRRASMPSCWSSPTSTSTSLANFPSLAAQRWNLGVDTPGDANSLPPQGAEYLAPHMRITTVEWPPFKKAVPNPYAPHAAVLGYNNPHQRFFDIADEKERGRTIQNNNTIVPISHSVLQSEQLEDPSSARKKVHVEAMQKLAAVIERRAREKSAMIPPGPPASKPSIFLSPQPSPVASPASRACARGTAGTYDQAPIVRIASIPIATDLQPCDFYNPLTPELSPVYISPMDSNFIFDQEFETLGTQLSCINDDFEQGVRSQHDSSAMYSFEQGLCAQPEYHDHPLATQQVRSARAVLPAINFQTCFKDDACAFGAENADLDGYLTENFEFLHDGFASLQRTELTQSFCDIVQSLREIETQMA